MTAAATITVNTGTSPVQQDALGKRFFPGGPQDCPPPPGTRTVVERAATSAP